MKQQVVDTNTGTLDPNLLFDIDALSMQQVQVLGDELDITARRSAPISAAFHRPDAVGRAATMPRLPSVMGRPRPSGAHFHSVHSSWCFICIFLVFDTYILYV